MHAIDREYFSLKRRNTDNRLIYDSRNLARQTVRRHVLPISDFFVWRSCVRVHYIDFNRLEVYEAGAFLVSLLAYPRESEEDDKRRCGVFTSLCACAIRGRAEADPDWAAAPQLVKPVYTSRTDRDSDRDLRTLPRLLRDRMIAARTAYSFLEEAETGEAPELPSSVKRLSINEISELVLEDAGYSDPENVETRIWRPSLPVIHLASAVHNYLHLDAEALGHGPLLNRRDVIEYVIRNAEYFEVLIGRSRRLRVNADRLVRFRLRWR
jgi:hypothetical protein